MFYSGITSRRGGEEMFRLRNTRIYVITVLLITISLSFIACGNKNETAKNDTEKEIGLVDAKSELVNHVLDRGIYFKDAGMEHYYDSMFQGYIYDYNKTVGYIDDWKFKDILNEKYYNDIDWNVVDSSDGDFSLVSFSGKKIIDSSEVEAVFLVPNDYYDSILLYRLDLSGKTVKASDYLVSDLSEAEAMSLMDVFGSVTLALASEECFEYKDAYYGNNGFVEDDFLYDGACFTLYEGTAEPGTIVYIADRDGLCISFDDEYYIPMNYSDVKEGYDAWPDDDPESHIIIKSEIVNGANGIEVMSSGSYGKYYGYYMSMPDRDMWED